MGRVAQDAIHLYRNRVLESRMKAGIKNQKTLAEMTGISPTVISELESGKRFLSSKIALIIRDKLGCSLDDLYERI